MFPGISGLTANGNTMSRLALGCYSHLNFTPGVIEPTRFILGTAHSGLFRVAILQSRSAYTT